MSMVSVADLRSAKRLSTATWDSLSPEDRRYAHSLLGSMYHYYDDLATYTAIANGRLEQLKREFSLAEEGLANYQQENERLKSALVKYGSHAYGCSNKRNVGDCSCGLWQSLRSAEPQSGPT